MMDEAQLKQDVISMSHPVANIFPLLSEEQFSALYDDIAQNGLIEPIVVDAEGKIIDGRNRFRICKMLGIEPRFETYNSKLPVFDYIVSMNLKRRHLSVTQRGLIGAQLKSLYAKGAKERQGHGQTAPGKTLVEKLPEALGRARDQAGAAVGVSGKTIDAAVTVKEQGIPELLHAVEEKVISLSAAANIAKDADEEEQRKNLESVLKLKEAAKREKRKERTKKSADEISDETLAQILQKMPKLNLKGLQRLSSETKARLSELQQ